MKLMSLKPVARLAIAGVFFCLIFSARAELHPVSSVNLGPFEIARFDSRVWSPASDEEFNHWAVFHHKSGVSAATVSYAALTPYEKKLGSPEKTLEFVHRSWLDFLIVKGASFTREKESYSESGNGRYQATLWFRHTDKTFIVERFYRLIENQGLVLIFTFESLAGADQKSAYADFFRLMNYTRINSGYEFSPCERVGVMGRQFERFLAVKQAYNDGHALKSYKEGLVDELTRIAKEDPHTRAAARHLLAGIADIERIQLGA